MAEGDHVDIPEEVNPSVPTLSPPPQTHAPPPFTPASVLPVYSGTLPTHPPPPASSGAPQPPVSPTSAATDDQARIAALEGTVNQMATNMAELLALLRGPNRASSSSTPPPGQGPMTEPTPWIPPTQALENMEAPPPPTLHTSMAHPVTGPYPPPPAPTAVPLPPAAFLSSEHILLIDAGKKLDMGIKLGKIEGPTGKEEQSSKNAATLPSPTELPMRVTNAAALRYPDEKGPKPTSASNNR
ncbi:extensin-like [Punica granatum]|uniref:Extensin-like n=1 Tax=Punica granatum TaxID=22663 RepID=A0A6P8D0L2_PUNGR|nr:extensin-like [Punica granatum]